MAKLGHGKTGRDAPNAVLGVAIVATVVFVLAYDGGTYAVSDRALVGIGTAWIATLLALRGGLSIMTRGSVAAAGCLSGLALLTVMSASWSPSVEASLLEFDRALMYLSIFVCATVAARQWGIAAIGNGLTLGIVAVALLALGSRVLPGVVPTSHLERYLPGTASRLSYPVNYWNALGMLVALALPGLLSLAAHSRRASVVGLSLLPVPAIIAVIFLTSSRGAVLVAVTGTLAIVVVSRSRWAAVGAASVSLGAAVVVVHSLRVRPALVDGPLASSVARAEGHRFLLVLLAVSVITAAAQLGLRALLSWVQPPRPIGVAAAAAAIVLVIVLGVAAHPVHRFEAFKQPASEAAIADPKAPTVAGHLVSATGSGRWQLWSSAAQQFRAHPALGGGAGSFEQWWLQHGTLDVFVRDAHSLWLQSLAELGPLGLALILGAFVVGLAPIRLAKARRDPASGVLTAVLVAFIVGASIDWIWEVTAVGLVGIGALAALAATHGSTVRVAPVTARLIAAAAVGAVLVQTAAFAADLSIRQSQADAASGRLQAAADAASRAGVLVPWAATPYLQRALVREEEGDLVGALADARSATARAPRDWAGWLTRARIELELTQVRAARRSLSRARALNPRSPVFTAHR